MAHGAPALPPWRRRRLALGALCAGLGLAWLLDVEMIWPSHPGGTGWLPSLSGLAAVALLLVPGRRLPAEWRAGVAAVGSLAMTLDLVLVGRSVPDWGLLETTCLLILLIRTCRSARPAAALAVSAALAAAVIDEPLRTGGTGITLTYPFLLTFVVGGAIGGGCYLRMLDARRARMVAAVRLNERLQLARDLHDFVAHHVTGIVVQAQAAGFVHHSAPHSVGPILRNIAEAGQETLDSMRRLVRVLREDEDTSQDRGDLYAELARLVSAFCGPDDDHADTRLEITSPARRTRLAPDAETAVQRLVQEALTNVRRHAPGARVAIRVDTAGDDLLRVDVHNTAPTRQAESPAGGRSGYGLMGLRERALAAGGTLAAGPADDGGWRITAHFPAFPALPQPAVAREARSMPLLDATAIDTGNR
jgi:signal transduction histidine kinase